MGAKAYNPCATTLKKPEILELLIVKAVEESDPKGESLALAERQKASREAGLPPVDPVFVTQYNQSQTALRSSHKEYIQRRAQCLFTKILTRFPVLKSWMGLFYFSRKMIVGVWLVAFIGGVLANELSVSGRIEIIHIGILSLVVWNLTIFLFHLYQLFIQRDNKEPVKPLFLRRFESLQGKRLETQDGWMPQAFRTFVTDAWAVFGRPYRWGVKIVLHIGAIMAILGAVAGLYMRGLAFEYEAGWGSTFISPSALEKGVHLFLGPASFLTGLELPNADQLSRLKWLEEGADRNAAPWIHLFAVTSLIWVVTPRLFLAALLWSRIRWYSRDFPLPWDKSPYYQRLILATHGHGETVVVIPFGYSPEEDSRRTVRELLANFLGNRVDVQFLERVTYGEGDTWLQDAHGFDKVKQPANYVICLFNATATPEKEVHGEFLLGIKDLMNEKKLGRHLIVGLDASVFKRKLSLAPGSEDRYQVRLDAWTDLAQSCGLPLTELNETQWGRNEGGKELKKRIWIPGYRPENDSQTTPDPA